MLRTEEVEKENDDDGMVMCRWPTRRKESGTVRVGSWRGAGIEESGQICGRDS